MTATIAVHPTLQKVSPDVYILNYRTIIGKHDNFCDFVTKIILISTITSNVLLYLLNYAYVTDYSM